jgi:predicted RNase H-related nuclease YkuK (DUF458 family)
MGQAVENLKPQVQKWKRPSHPKLAYDFNGIIRELNAFAGVLSVNGEPVDYKIYIGTDSQRHGQFHDMVTAVGILRTNMDGRAIGSMYFHTSQKIGHIYNVKQKMMTEAWLTLETHGKLKEEFDKLGMKIPMELHFDVNPNPKEKSSVALADVTGMAKGTGCTFKVKPEAWMASGVANKHSK